MDNKQQLAAVAAMFLLVKRKHRRKQRSRSCWVKPWLLLRQQQGMYHNLVTEFRLQDEDNFRGILRLDVNSFEQLLLMVSPLVVKETTRMRKPISPGERLSVTLRFLATGESFRSLSYQYRIHWTTIGEIVPETCRAIAKVLKEYYSIIFDYRLIRNQEGLETETKNLTKLFRIVAKTVKDDDLKGTYAEKEIIEALEKMTAFDKGIPEEDRKSCQGQTGCDAGNGRKCCIKLLPDSSSSRGIP